MSRIQNFTDVLITSSFKDSDSIGPDVLFCVSSVSSDLTRLETAVVTITVEQIIDRKNSERNATGLFILDDLECCRQNYAKAQ